MATTTSSTGSATSSLASLGLAAGTITSTGVGSGLDVQGIVSQLVAAERAPEDKRIASATAGLASEVSALGKLKGAMSSFQSAVQNLQTTTQLRPRTATVSDTTIFTATATGTAAPGNYSIKVNQLAQAAQLNSAAFSGGSTSTVGTGTLSLQMGSSTISFAVDSTNNTLAGIRDAINNAAGNPGISASILTASDGAHLIISGSATGVSNAIKITATGGNGGLSGLTYDPATKTGGMSVVTAAQDASLTISGIAVTSPSNTVSTAIDGVTLNLLQAQGTATTVSPVSLTVANDTSGMQTQLDTFIKAYNSLRDTVSSLSSYDASTGTAGPLLGDALMNSVDSQMRSIISSNVVGATPPYTNLASLGVTTDSATGDLSYDATKLQAVLTANPNALSSILGGTKGLSARVYSALDAHLSTSGDLKARDDGDASKQKDLQTQTTALNARMAVIQQRYLDQFNALDAALTQMQSTSSYLTQQLAAMNKTGG